MGLYSPIIDFDWAGFVEDNHNKKPTFTQESLRSFVFVLKSCIAQTRDLIGCTNSSGSCGFPLRLVLEGKNIRDRLLLSHSTPAQIKMGGGGRFHI